MVITSPGLAKSSSKDSNMGRIRDITPARGTPAPVGTVIVESDIPSGSID